MISGDMAMVLGGVAVLADLRWNLGLLGRGVRGVLRLVSVARCLAVRLVRALAWRWRAAPVTFGAARWMRQREAAAAGLLGARA